MWLQSNRGDWNNVLDDQPIVLDHNPIDDQPEDFLLGLEARLDERVPNARSKMAAMVLDPSPAFLQLRERNRCCLIRVDQTLDFTIQPPELPRDPRAFVLTGAVSREIAAALLKARPQQRWLAQ